MFTGHMGNGGTVIGSKAATEESSGLKEGCEE